MKVYLIDGCNYILKKIVDDKIHISAGLEKFIIILNELKKSTNDEFIVFIDGNEETIFNRGIKNSIMCIFSSAESDADNTIIDYIKNNPAKNYVVVTDDNELRSRVKNLKAGLLYCDEFASLCKEVMQTINEENQERDSSNYIFFKQNPFISDAQVEEQYKEFLGSDGEKGWF